MEHLCQGRTTIAIAHRLHTITHADRIVVIEDGTVVESGRHDDLLRKGGRYASFYRLQLKDQEHAPEPRGRIAAATGGLTPTTIANRKTVDECRQGLRHRARAAGVDCGGRHRQVVSGAPHLVRGTQLRRAHPEMGHDERDPPFFFAKPADAIVPDGGTVPYPPLTKDMHHEVELVVALKSGGRNIKLEKASDCIYGYGVGIDLTRRDLQIASRDMKRPWEVGKAFDHSAPCGAAGAGRQDRPSDQGPHRAQVQRQGAPGRRPRRR